MQFRFSSIKLIYTLIFGVGLIIVSGGGTNSFSQLLILVFTGGFLIASPPKNLPGKWLVGTCAALILWILLTAMVPIPFLGAHEWMKEAIPDLNVGSTLSLQPLLSLEKLVYLLVGIAWLFLVIDRPMNHYKRMKGMRVLTWVLSFLGLIALGGLLFKYQHPFTWGTQRFSYFPNHNQSGAVLAIGVIFSMGMILRAMKKRSWEVLLYMLCFGVLAFAIIMGMSRSSVLIMIAGTALCLLLQLEKRNYNFYLKIGAPFLIVLVAVFILYGGRLLDEFVSLLKEGGVQEELRILIYADTFKLITAFPFLGVGLGCFRYIFPSFQEYAATEQAIHHPESDFLWIWSELGLPGVVIVILGITLLFIRLDPVDIIKTKGGRLMGFVSLIMFLVAGLVEVSGHRLGTALLAILVYGLSQPERAKLNPNRWVPWVGRTVGGFFLIIAVIWIVQMSRGKMFVKEDVHAFYSKPILEIIGEKEASEVIQEVDDWIHRYPMFSKLHEVRGRLLLQGETTDVALAHKEFQISQQLEPNRWKLYMFHGLFLYSFDFDLAMGFWYKGIEVAGASKGEAFKMILRNLPRDQYAKLRDLTYSDHDLQFLYYATIRGDRNEFSRELGLELAINPELNGFSSEQKEALLWRYTELNGPTMLKRLLGNYPVLGSENWTTRAQMEAGLGNYKEASRLAVMNLTRPEMIDLTRGRSLSSIRSEYLLDSDDQLKVVALIQKQEQDYAYKDALVSVGVARKKGITNDYLEFETALLRFYLEEYEESWIAFRKIIAGSIEW